MEKLLARINSANNPIIVPVNIEKYSTPNNCFYNVMKKVALDGGHIVYGWKIHHGKLLDEAERHAVWRSPNGELIDISPFNSNGKITFIEEDMGWKYRGQFEDNIRVNITDNPLVDDLILLCETITKLWQTSSRKSSQEISIHVLIKKQIDVLEANKIKFEFFALKNQDRECLCFCGSSLKYKKCHVFNEETQREILGWANNVLKEV